MSGGHVEKKKHISKILLKGMATIIKGINALTQDEMAIIIQDMMEAEELILLTHDSEGDMQIVMTGYYDATLAMSDLIDAQAYMMRTIIRPDEPPDRRGL